MEVSYLLTVLPTEAAFSPSHDHTLGTTAANQGFARDAQDTGPGLGQDNGFGVHVGFQLFAGIVKRSRTLRVRVLASRLG